jgi:site-specific DNA recombinase
VINCDGPPAVAGEQRARVAGPKRCAIYIRDTGRTDPVDAPHHQHEVCEAYVAHRAAAGWETTATYTDSGRSRTPSKRAEYQRLMADVADGKVDVVVVDRVDRLIPSLRDLVSFMHALDAAGCALVSATQMINTAEATSRFTLSVFVVCADYERETETQHRRARAEKSAR